MRHGKARRRDLPANGCANKPIRTALPIRPDSRTRQPLKLRRFQKDWRAVARAAGIPDDVMNRDSRAGGVTEVSDVRGMFSQALVVLTRNDPSERLVPGHLGFSSRNTSIRSRRSPDRSTVAACSVSSFEILAIACSTSLCSTSRRACCTSTRFQTRPSRYRALEALPPRDRRAVAMSWRSTRHVDTYRRHQAQ